MLLNRDTIQEERNQKVARFLKYFGVIMAIFYFMMGTAFVLFPVIEGLSSFMRYAVATLFFIYGGFRLYRALKK